MKISIEYYDIISIKYNGVVKNMATIIEVYNNKTNENEKFIIEGHNNIDNCISYIYSKLLKEWWGKND